jgi:hypothetical protein
MIEIGAASVRSSKEVFLPLPLPYSVNRLTKQINMSQLPSAMRDSLQDVFDCLQINLTAPSTDLSPESIGHLNTSILPKSSPNNDNLSIVIARESPYRFRAMSPEFLQMFRFQSQELAASSLRLLFGPETDVAGLRALVEGSACCCQTQIPLVLYRKDGDEVHCTVRLLPKDAGNQQHDDCSLAFELDTGCSSSRPISPVHAEPLASGAASPRADFTAATDGAICTLLSQQAVVGSDVEIHIRAVRSAAAAAATAARHERHAGQTLPE